MSPIRDITIETPQCRMVLRNLRNGGINVEMWVAPLPGYPESSVPTFECVIAEQFRESILNLIRNNSK